MVGSSLAGRQWGPRLGRILVVLPIVAGPILLILSIEHGSRFAAQAASAATLGIVPLAFTVVFAYGSRRFGWLLRRFDVPIPVSPPLPSWDLPARALATGVLVVVITALADVLGPTATGVLALLRGIVPGLDGFALFCFVVAVTIDGWGAALAFGLATAASVAFATVLAGRSSATETR